MASKAKAIVGGTDPGPVNEHTEIGAPEGKDQILDTEKDLVSVNAIESETVNVMDVITGTAEAIETTIENVLAVENEWAPEIAEPAETVEIIIEKKGKSLQIIPPHEQITRNLVIL